MITAWQHTRWRVRFPGDWWPILHYPNRALFWFGWRLLVLSDGYPAGPHFLTLTRRLA